MRQLTTFLLAATALGLGACSAEKAAKPVETQTSGTQGSGTAASGAESAGTNAAATTSSGTYEEMEGAPADDPAASGAAAGSGLDFAPGGPISDEELGNYHVAMTCAIDGEEVGTLTFELWTEAAPITTRNFLRLCAEGFYDGVSFHRIMREFMIQGGDPTGTGSGNSPHGTIKAEFSDDPARAHGYGVLSMARTNVPDSASCQFFLCCADTPSVWGLDGQYASFGKLTSGVDPLEALANVSVKASPRGEPSVPTQDAKIVRAEVREGPAPKSETPVERPAPDLGGEPAAVVVQHVLVSFKGAPRITATRSKEEAAELAQQVAERARGGEDFNALILEYSSDPVQPGDETPGTYKLNNNGVSNAAGQRKLMNAGKAAQAEMQELSGKMSRGEITQAEFQARQMELGAEIQKLQEEAGMARGGMVQGFGDTAFSLEVGEIGIAEYDQQNSPYGWHVIKRIK